MGYNSCMTDPDTSIRVVVKPCGFNHYEYSRTFVDYGMFISDNPDDDIDELNETYLIPDNNVKHLFDEKVRYLVQLLDFKHKYYLE